jgi:hypothetical protein
MAELTLKDIEGDTFYKELEALLKIKPKQIYLYRPKNNLLARELLQVRSYFYKYLLIKNNYFVVRHRADCGTKRHFDMIYIHHTAEEHIQNGEPFTLLEKIRYRWLLFLGYAKEIHSITMLINSKSKSEKDNKFLDKYCQLYVDQHSIYKQDRGDDYLH